MYFFVDTADQSVTAHKSNGQAAKAALAKLGLEPVKDPVKEARIALGDRGLILNLSAAFLSISASEGPAAQELAQSFHEAVELFYQSKWVLLRLAP